MHIKPLKTAPDDKVMLAPTLAVALRAVDTWTCLLYTSDAADE